MGQERRQDPRYNVQIKVEIFRGEKLIAELSTQDISIGGLFLFYPKSVPLGDFLSLRLQLGQFGAVTLMGEVVHSIPDVGLGIRFFDIDAKNRQILDSFLASGQSYDPA